MIMSEQTIPIPGRLKNVAIGGHIAGSEDIDAGEGKTQKQVNDETNDTLALYQSEISGLNSQNYVSVSSYSSLPVTGSADTIYRVSSWDGNANSGEGAADVTKYTEYAWNGTAYIVVSVKTQIGEVFDISEYKAVGGTLATFENLSAALDNGNNVPVGIRKGGMSVKFVQSSDNNYVQARCMAQNFTTDATQWQGVDDKPTAGSKNLVESSGVYLEIDEIKSGNSIEVTSSSSGSFEYSFIKDNYYKIIRTSGSPGNINVSTRTDPNDADTTIDGPFALLNNNSFVIFRANNNSGYLRHSSAIGLKIYNLGNSIEGLSEKMSEVYNGIPNSFKTSSATVFEYNFIAGKRYRLVNISGNDCVFSTRTIPDGDTVDGPYRTNAETTEIHFTASTDANYLRVSTGVEVKVYAISDSIYGINDEINMLKSLSLVQEEEISKNRENIDTNAITCEIKGYYGGIGSAILDGRIAGDNFIYTGSTPWKKGRINQDGETATYSELTYGQMFILNSQVCRYNGDRLVVVVPSGIIHVDSLEESSVNYFTISAKDSPIVYKPANRTDNWSISALNIENSKTLVECDGIVYWYTGYKYQALETIYEDAETINFSTGHYIPIDGNIGDTVDIQPVISVGQKYIICSVNDRTRVELIGTFVSGQRSRLWCFLDKDNKILAKADANETDINSIPKFAPHGSVTCIINCAILSSTNDSYIIKKEYINVDGDDYKKDVKKYPSRVQFTYDHDFKNLSDLYARFSFSNDGQRTIMEQVYSVLDDLKTQYPSYITKIDAADDVSIEYPEYANLNGVATEDYLATPSYRTYMYKLVDINISAGQTSTNKKKKIFIVCGTHGIEVAACANICSFIKLLCEGTDLNYFRLRSMFDFYIIPCLNGYGIYNQTRVNANLVDINRNYPVKYWSRSIAGKGESSSYSGETGGSEFETQLVMAQVLKIKPDIFIDHHNYWQDIPSQFYSDGTDANICRLLYNSLVDISYSLIKNLPYYFGTTPKLFIDVNNPDYPVTTIRPDTNIGYSHAWCTQNGVDVAIIIEINCGISYLDGIYNSNTGQNYSENVFKIGEYTLKNQIFRIAQYILNKG